MPISTSPFQALVFDLGGVVVRHDNRVLFERLASRCADGWTAERVVSLFRQGSGWGTGAPIGDFYRQLGAEAGYDAPWPTFVEDWCCHLSVDASMLSVLERLAAHHRIVIFSNTNREHWDFLLGASDGALGRYEPYLSHEIGLEKPAVEAFAAVAAKAGLEPARCVFFDDVEANVDGARRAGFEAELFTGEDRLLVYLRGRGVRIG